MFTKLFSPITIKNEVGDAVRARRAINATREAFDVAISFDKKGIDV